MKTGTKLQFVNKDDASDTINDFFIGGGFTTDKNGEVIYRDEYKLVDTDKVKKNTNGFINDINDIGHTGALSKGDDGNHSINTNPMVYYILNSSLISDNQASYNIIDYTFKIKFITKIFNNNNSWAVYSEMIKDTSYIYINFGEYYNTEFKSIKSWKLDPSYYVGDINSTIGHENDFFKFNISLENFKNNNRYYALEINVPNSGLVTNYNLYIDYTINSANIDYSSILYTYDAESLKQNIECVLQTLRGELPYNTSLGVPLRLGLDDTKLTIQNTILSMPGVQSVKFIDSYQEQRKYYFNIKVKSNFGDFTIDFEQ